jgi:hypothetical protein
MKRLLVTTQDGFSVTVDAPTWAIVHHAPTTTTLVILSGYDLPPLRNRWGLPLGSLPNFDTDRNIRIDNLLRRS